MARGLLSPGPLSERRSKEVLSAYGIPVTDDELCSSAREAVAAARRLVHVPAGRFAEVREIANAALFLASDESSYVTATSFMVDGGISQAYTTPE